MAIRLGKGRASIMIEGPLADGIEADIRELLGPLADEMEREGRAILSHARAEWPVDTGKSRDGWRMATQLMPGQYTVEVALINPVPYVIYLRSAKRGTQTGGRLTSPLEALVRRPVREANKRLKIVLPQILGKHLTDLLAGGTRG